MTTATAARMTAPPARMTAPPARLPASVQYRLQTTMLVAAVPDVALPDDDIESWAFDLFDHCMMRAIVAGERYLATIGVDPEAYGAAIDTIARGCAWDMVREYRPGARR